MKRLMFFSLFILALFLVGCDENNNISTEPNSQVNEESYGDKPESLEKGRSYAEFEIILENMTPATGPGASQPFSPPVMTAHTPFYHIFKNNHYASNELAQLAEDAVNPPMIDLLNNSRFAFEVVEGTTGPIFPGESGKFIIKTKLPFIKFSLVSMLVNTNDGFTGIDAAKLPFRGSRTYYLSAYDAGTEVNTELESNIPGPCCGSPLVRVPSHDKIKYHTGILGNGDLDPAVYGWSRNVAKLIITRLK